MSVEWERLRPLAATGFRWWHRVDDEPWQLAACVAHGVELAELGFTAGADPRLEDVDQADHCALCTGLITVDYLPAARPAARAVRRG